MMVPITFRIILLLYLINLPSNQCTVLLPKRDADLIVKTCARTDSPDLCGAALRSDPRSSSADVKGLAQIMLELSLAKAKDILKRIHQLNDGTKDPILKRYYGTCIEEYEATVINDLPEAMSELNAKDYPSSRTNADYAAETAVECENFFHGPPEARKSPLTKENNAMHDLAAIAASIIYILG
ncbi:hypothetical protein RJ640_014654 [Escallonia rubra]|uniref:Pectinesterase inhibitor domain-containing protein n=1 Tax=Escallonia rubra TaxID=112253 RepID=A0AA88RJ80_9ASTE|nr:hypothetical protein RJ640_014654 [Escallonia rubra]